MPRKTKRDTDPASLPGVHRWTVPMSQGARAEILISGAAGIEQFRDLKRFLDLLEIAYDQAEPKVQGEKVETIAAGDIVQIRPSADSAFGGLVFRVGKFDGWKLQGYFLVPHRGGYQEAWQQFKPCEVGKIGTLKWPEAEWGLCREESERRRLLWADPGDLLKSNKETTKDEPISNNSPSAWRAWR